MVKQQKLFKFDLVLMLVFFSFFLGMVLVNIAFYRFIHWVNLVLFMLPSMVLFGLSFFKHKHELKKLTEIIINISLGIILIVTTFINFGIMMVDESLSPNTSSYAYEHELNLYGFPDNKYIAHFPAKIPNNAHNVHFFEEPGFGPGGTSFILRYTANEDDVEGIYKLYSKMDKGLMNGETNIPDYYYQFATKIGYDPLPDDFHLFIVRKNQLPTDALAGSVSGVAISKQRNEVIYFYESLS